MVCDNDMVSEQVSICVKGLVLIMWLNPRFESFVKMIQVYGSKGTGDELQKISSQFHSDLIVVTGIPNLKMNLLSAMDDYRIRSCTLLIVLEKLQNHKEDKNKVDLLLVLHRRSVLFMASQTTIGLFPMLTCRVALKSSTFRRHCCRSE